MLNTNNSSNGIKIGYIASLMWGLIPVRKVNESCRMMMEARTRKVIINQNVFLLRNHLWTSSINTPLSSLIFGLFCFFTNRYRVYTHSLNYVVLRSNPKLSDHIVKQAIMNNPAEEQQIFLKQNGKCTKSFNLSSDRLAQHIANHVKGFITIRLQS